MNKLLKPGATKAAKRIQPLKARKYAKKQAAMQVADAEELPSAAAKKVGSFRSLGLGSIS